MFNGGGSRFGSSASMSNEGSGAQGQTGPFVS